MLKVYTMTERYWVKAETPLAAAEAADYMTCKNPYYELDDTVVTGTESKVTTHPFNPEKEAN